jgi:hypothetical protein
MRGTEKHKRKPGIAEDVLQFLVRLGVENELAQL